MPCRMETPQEVGRALEETANELTQFLCYTLRSLNTETKNKLLQKNPSLRQWWANHLKGDRLRAQKEAAKKREQIIRKQAADKLTAKEKIALGLYDLL